MCFYVRHGREPNIAEVDIEVVKYGFMYHEDFVPMWKTFFHYKKDVLTERVILKITAALSANNTGYIAQGYHSYWPYAGYNNLYKQLASQRGVKSAKGKFIIPKGTLYYHDGQSLVSEQIIYKGNL